MSLMEQGYTIKQESYRVWKVISPKAKEYYIIKDIIAGKWICTCPYYSRLPRACKHILQVRIIDKETES